MIAVQQRVDRFNVVNCIQKTILDFAVLFMVIVVQQRVDNFYVVDWIQYIVFLCAVLLILNVLQQSGYLYG